jgi:hypothetical protein
MAPTGQLHAIDVFEELEDPRAGPTLIALLSSDDDTVRDWAAHALGVLNIENAVPALVRAYRATRDRGTRPDWTEAVSMRHAMTALGARDPVVPPLTRSMQVQVPKLGAAWPAGRLQDVFEDLADHDQVVLYFQLLRVEGDHAYHVGDAGGSWGAELDYDQRWHELVRHAKEWALLYASAISPDAGLVATIEWIGRNDL